MKIAFFSPPVPGHLNRDNARKLQKAIIEANGLSVAADLVEESLGVAKTAGKG